MSVSRVCVMGLGYVGLPTAVALANAGHDVIGVDTSERVLEALAQGATVLQEPGLSAEVQRAVSSGRLSGSQVPMAADVFMIAVPTPADNNSQPQADLTAVRAAAATLATVLRPGNLVVLESTVPPRTTIDVLCPLLAAGSGLRIGEDLLVAFCPERVLPGRVLHELVHNDRLIGGVNRASAEAARDLYASFVLGELLITDATTAELVKLMENTHRDVNIALANEFALVAEHLGTDVWEAIALANRHPRVQFLNPGPGVGGHCIAVDPWFVVEAAPALTRLIPAGRAINDRMPAHVIRLVAEALGGLAGRRIVALGITYKADVDDIRESPAAIVVEQLRQQGAEVRVHDPMVANDVSIEELAVAVDCLLLLVDHTAYKQFAPASIADRMRNRVMVDTRNLWQPDAWVAAGFSHIRLGDGKSQREASMRSHA